MAPPPSDPPQEELTRFIAGLGHGDVQSDSKLMGFVYEELRAIAEGYARGPGDGKSIQPTLLVHDAFLKLFHGPGGKPLDLKDRAHFFALAARAMRQILVDHARRRALVRENATGATMILEALPGSDGESEVDLIDLDEALNEFRELDSRACQVVEMRYFAGMPVEEVALVLNVSEPTVKRDWASARAWLARRLLRSDGTAP